MTTQPPVEGRCDECGFDYDAGALSAVLDAVVPQAGECGMTLVTADPDEVRHRPDPDTWSALEYGCHVRDVLQVQRDRIAQALVEDYPNYRPMDRDRRVTALRYLEQEPATVAADLVRNARAFTESARTLGPEQLRRVGVYNYPVPADRTLDWLIRHTAHEVRHHLGDVRRVLGGGTTRPAT